MRPFYKWLGASTALRAFDACHSERSKESLIFSMSSAPFEMIVSVIPEDIDEQNHVNNTVYLRWSRKLPLRIGKRSPTRKHKRTSAGSCCGMRSITKRLHARAIRLFCAPGSAKPPGSRSSDSQKFCAARIDSCFRMLGLSGVQSTRKPAAQSVCRRKCASSFRFDVHHRCKPRDDFEGEYFLPTKS